MWISEIVATITSIAGIALLSAHNKWSKWGWPIFTLSNIFWIYYAVEQQQTGFLVVSIVYLFFDIVGWYKTWT